MKAVRGLIFVLVIFAVFFIFVTKSEGGTPPSTYTSSSSSDTTVSGRVTISGRVYDTRSNSPIGGASVRIAAAGFSQSATTDASGGYCITNCPADRALQLTCRKTRYKVHDVRLSSMATGTVYNHDIPLDSIISGRGYEEGDLIDTYKAKEKDVDEDREYVPGVRPEVFEPREPEPEVPTLHYVGTPEEVGEGLYRTTAHSVADLIYSIPVIGPAIEATVEGGRETCREGREGLGEAWNSFTDGVGAIGDAFVSLFSGDFSGCIDAGQKGMNDFVDAAQHLGNVPLDVAQGGANTILDASQAGLNGMVDFGQLILDINGNVDKAQAKFNNGVDLAQRLGNVPIDTAQNIGDEVVDAIQDRINSGIDFAQAGGELGVDLAKAGKDKAEGFIQDMDIGTGVIRYEGDEAEEDEGEASPTLFLPKKDEGIIDLARPGDTVELKGDDEKEALDRPDFEVIEPEKPEVVDRGEPVIIDWDGDRPEPIEPPEPPEPPVPPVEPLQPLVGPQQPAQGPAGPQGRMQARRGLIPERQLPAGQRLTQARGPQERLPLSEGEEKEAQTRSRRTGWILLILYIYLSLALHIIAKKTATPLGWLAWIPIVNFYLMNRIAGRPGWWFWLFLIPWVNMVIAVIVWMGIAKVRNKTEWLGLLLLIPIVNFILPGYLAFSR